MRPKCKMLLGVDVKTIVHANAHHYLCTPTLPVLAIYLNDLAITKMFTRIKYWGEKADFGPNQQIKITTVTFFIK